MTGGQESRTLSRLPIRFTTLLLVATHVAGVASRGVPPLEPSFKKGGSGMVGSLRGTLRMGAERRLAFYVAEEVQSWVASHNEERAKHFGGHRVEWDKELAGFAQQHATNKVMSNVNCAPEWNEENTMYGETLYWGVYQSGQTPWLPSEVVREWVSQAQHYDYERNVCAKDHDCTAYLQVVWKNTTRVGCGEVFCPYNDGISRGTAQFFVCNYFPGALWDQGARPF